MPSSAEIRSLINSGERVFYYQLTDTQVYVTALDVDDSSMAYGWEMNLLTHDELMPIDMTCLESVIEPPPE